MKRKPRAVPAGEFKARCLALLDEVAATGETLVVTKRGRPVAEVVPCREVPSLRGSIVREDGTI
jgi:prevent-host-death family protein